MFAQEYKESQSRVVKLRGNFTSKTWLPVLDDNKDLLEKLCNCHAVKETATVPFRTALLN